MLTRTRAWVPGMTAKFTARRDPSVVVKECEPSAALEASAFSAPADHSDTASSGLPTRLACSSGAASTVPLLSTRTDEPPARPPRLVIIFDNQSRLMLAVMTDSDSGLMAE